MMRLFSLALAMLMATIAEAQNVGIGTNNPVRGKLVVDGVAGAGATNAIFGSMEAGISLQQNWPTIGFNYYRDDITPGSAGKFMKAGYAALMSLSQDNGILYAELFNFGGAGQNPFNARIGWAVTPAGRMGIAHAAPGAMLDVVRGGAPEGTAAFRGTSFNSHFNFDVEEHTYIRGGKTNSSLILNDIPGGKTGIGDDATNVSLIKSTLSVFGSLQMPVRRVTTPTYTPGISDFTIIVDPLNFGNNFKRTLITLPNATLVPGRIYHIVAVNLLRQDVDSFVEYLDCGCNPGYYAQVDGLTTEDIGDRRFLYKNRKRNKTAMTVQSTGTDWVIIAEANADND